MEKYNVIIRDKNKNILTKDELIKKEIDCDAYYQNIALISKRIQHCENNFDNRH